MDKKFKITGAVFDLDGTLLDSMGIWTDLGEAYLRTKGIAAEENLSEKLKSLSLNQSAGYFIEKRTFSNVRTSYDSDYRFHWAHPPFLIVIPR